MTEKKSKLTKVQQTEMVQRLTTATFSQPVGGTDLTFREWLHTQLHAYRALHREACKAYDYSTNRVRYKLNAMNANAPSSFLDRLYMTTSLESRKLKRVYLRNDDIKDVVRYLVKYCKRYYSIKMSTQSSTKLIDVDELITRFNSQLASKSLAESAGMSADLIQEYVTSLLANSADTTEERAKEVIIDTVERVYRNCYLSERDGVPVIVDDDNRVRLNTSKHKNCNISENADGSLTATYDLTASDKATRELHAYINANRSINVDVTAPGKGYKMALMDGKGAKTSQQSLNGVDFADKEYLKKLIRECFAGDKHEKKYIHIAIERLLHGISYKDIELEETISSKTISKIEKRVCDYVKASFERRYGKQTYTKIRKH